MKHIILRAAIGVLVLGGFAYLMISSGTWSSAVIAPIESVLGKDAAQRFDTGVRDGLKAGEDRIRDAADAPIPTLPNQEDGKPGSSGGTAKNLDQIAEPGDERHPKYERALFGDGWQSGLDGCNTREQVLRRDLSQVLMRSDRKCKVESGVLNDPYLGKKINFNSTTDPQEVQIDHVVPLSAAWEMGAWKWDSNTRVAFANDLDELLAVDGPTNNRKSDKRPSQWMPPNQAFACTYATKYVAITKKYDLALERDDREKLRQVLAAC